MISSLFREHPYFLLIAGLSYVARWVDTTANLQEEAAIVHLVFLLGVPVWVVLNAWFFQLRLIRESQAHNFWKATAVYFGFLGLAVFWLASVVSKAVRSSFEEVQREEAQALGRVSHV